LTLQHITNYQKTMNEHRHFLQAAHAYPLPTFPGHEKEGMLQMLMRKKLEPSADEWVTTYSQARSGNERQIGVKGTSIQGNGQHGASQLQPDDLRDLWAWAGQTANGIAMEFVDALEDDYSIAERQGGLEHVVTGLKRDLDADSEDDEEADANEADENVKMEDAMPIHAPPKGPEKEMDPSRPPLPLDVLLKFMTTGQVPPGLY